MLMGVDVWFCELQVSSAAPLLVFVLVSLLLTISLSIPTTKPNVARFSRQNASGFQKQNKKTKPSWTYGERQGSSKATQRSRSALQTFRGALG